MENYIRQLKGKTTDFEAIPRLKNIHAINTKNKETMEKTKKKTFSIETQSNLKDIMSRQSASRRKVSLENNS